MLTPFPLTKTIDNILNCCPWAQLLQLLKMLIVWVRISVYGLLVRQNRNAKRVEYACKMFSKRFTTCFLSIQRLSHFRKFVKVSEDFGRPRRDQ
jgi:hypothetical protein